ncbi:MAG TPA: hypothetical protein VL172_03215, partial [Kofleriaceae bacterium]|nr:hypothetical protein [Kofleriaceae bacterium]
FSAARAKIAAWASAIAAFVVGAILTVVTGGAGAGVAWMLVASAISGAGGALAGAAANKAIMGSEYDFGGEGMKSVLEGAVTGMITAGSTKMAEGIMHAVAGPATMRAQLEAMERLAKGIKPTRWQQVVSGAKGMGYAASEEMLSEGITMGLEGIVPLHPGVYVDSWDEGVIKSVKGIRNEMAGFEERLLVAGAAAALTHGMGAGWSKIKGEKILKDDAASKAIREKLSTKLGRMQENLHRYFEIDEVVLEALASFIVERSADVIQGRPVDWSNLPEDLLKGFIQEYTELATEVHAGHYRVGHKRHKQIEQEIARGGDKLRPNERHHFEQINDPNGVGKIITVEEYLTAREGMFEARVALWEGELGRKLTPGERAAFQDFCRSAKDSAEYTKFLNTLPTSIPAVQKAGFTSNKTDDEFDNKDQNNDSDSNTQRNNRDTDGKGDKTTKKGDQGNRGNQDANGGPQLTADQMKLITGEVDPIANSTFKADIRGKSEPGKVLQAAEGALPHVAAMFPGKVEVVDRHLLKVTFDGGSFLVAIDTMVVESDKVATYQFLDGEKAVIKISEQARDKHAERAIAALVAEMIARRESMAGKGRDLNATDTLTPGGTGKTLSLHDLGKVAQVRVLLRQIQEAEHPVDGGKPNSVVVRQLNNDLDVLLTSMGLTGSTGQDRIDEAIKPLLTQQEQNALRIRGDQERRAQMTKALPEHAGVEVHNHFLGVVDADEFASKAKEAEARRL